MIQQNLKNSKTSSQEREPESSFFFSSDIFDSSFHRYTNQDVVTDRNDTAKASHAAEVDNANEIKFGQRFLSLLMKKNCPVHMEARNYTDSK